MTIIVHISDTHFGTQVPQVVHALKETVKAIGPDVVILSGDITQRARPSQFQAAMQYMDALPASKKISIPGNHDIPLFDILSRLLSPYRHYRHAFGALETIWNNQDICIIGFNATCRWRHTRGKLSQRTIVDAIHMARKRLKPGMILMVAVHQPLLTAWPEDSENILINADATARLFAENKVDIVLSGHVHVPLITTTQSAFPTLPRHFVLSGAGTAISHRTRPGAPNEFNMITCKNGELTILPYHYDMLTQCFVMGQANIFTSGGDQGWH